MDKDTEKILAALSYPIGLIGLILALIGESAYAKYHGWQGLFWGIAIFAVNIVLSMIFIIGWMIMPLVWLVWLVFSIIFAIKAYKGEQFEIPVISGIVKGIMKK
ncbi:DUF4870 domain-containing protein [Candidatus Woesearchaeota archaeon]|nr:DUF4870 domain-containing protein [Candidatus Woesearchaeota archaeon]